MKFIIFFRLDNWGQTSFNFLLYWSKNNDKGFTEVTRFLKDYFLQYTNQKFRLPLKEFFNEIGKKSRIGAKKWKPIFFRRRKRVDPEIRCLLINGFEVNFPLKKYRSWVRAFFGFQRVGVDICFKTGLFGRRMRVSKKKNCEDIFFGNRNWILSSRYFKIRKFENNIKTLFHRSKSKMLQQRAQRSKK